MGDIAVVPSAEEIDKITDAYAEQASVEQIAYRTGIPQSRVREVLDDKEVVRLALQRKAAKIALWSFGKGLDRLQDIIDTGSDSQAISAFREIARTLERVAPTTADSAPVATSLEDSMKQLGD